RAEPITGSASIIAQRFSMPPQRRGPDRPDDHARQPSRDRRRNSRGSPLVTPPPVGKLDAASGGRIEESTLPAPKTPRWQEGSTLPAISNLIMDGRVNPSCHLELALGRQGRPFLPSQACYRTEGSTLP